MSEYHECLKNGMVKFGDDFRRMRDVLGLFGITNKKGMKHGEIGIPKMEDSVACLYEEDGTGGWHHRRRGSGKFDSRGWEGADEIDEFNDDDGASRARREDELKSPKRHYAFYKMERQGVTWWKFFGIFEIDKEALCDPHGRCKACYKLVSEKGILPASGRDLTECGRPATMIGH